MKTRQKIRLGIILFSFFIFPATFYYFSPYLILEATTRGIVNGSFIVFLSLLAGDPFVITYAGWLPL
jgi:ferredoxin-type protein NapH